MASKEDPKSDGAEARRKQLRRVSFAEVEITSVHVFKRDEDYSDSTPPSGPKADDVDRRPTVGDGLGLFRDLRGDDDEEMLDRVSFFRPIESPSPGSSTVGSAVSNDEDDFFGPVSTSFIRPGRLSDSAASDDNHDITMDSTAFSMHFRSLARSESEDFKTPTMPGLGFKKKTPTQDVAEETSESLMVLTSAQKLAQESNVSVNNFRSGGRDSNEMSLIGENSPRYDYRILPPKLDALLAADNKVSKHGSPSQLADLKSSSSFDRDRSGGDEEIVWGTDDPNKATPEAFTEVPEADNSEILPGGQVAKDVFNRSDREAIMPENKSSSTPEQLDTNLIEAEVEIDGTNGFSSITKGTPRRNISWLLNLDAADLHGSTSFRSSQEYPKVVCHMSDSQRVDEADRMSESPLAESISSLSAKQREIFTHSTSPAMISISTPLPAQSALSTSKESAKRGLNLSSIQNSISKFRSLDTSPAVSALKNGIEKLKLKISNHLAANSPHDASHIDGSIEIPRGKQSPGSDLEHLNHRPEEVDGKIMLLFGGNGFPSPRDINAVSFLGQNRELAVAVEPGEAHVDLPGGASSKNEITDVTLRISSSNKEDSCSPTLSNNLWKIESRASEVGPQAVNVGVHHRKDDEDTHTPSGLLTSLIKKANQEASAEKLSLIETPSDLNSQPQQLMDLAVVNEKTCDSQETFSSAGCSTPYTEKLLCFSSGTRAKDAENLDLLPASAHEELLGGNNRADFRGDLSSFIREAPGSSASAHFRGRESPFKKSPLKEPKHSPRRIILTGSPFSREIANSSTSDVVQSLPWKERESTPSKSNYIRMINFQKDSYLSKRALPADNCEESSSMKRRSEEANLSDVCHVGKSSRPKRSIEVEKCGRRDIASYGEPSDEREYPKSDIPQSNWKDVLTKLSQDTDSMLFPLHDQLDLRGITMLEEAFAYLQKVRMYDIVTSEIQFERLPSQLGNALRKRSVGTSLLLQKLVYEKAKLQLILLRRDRLQKIAQNLSSGVQDSQNLRQILKERMLLPIRGNQPEHDYKLKNKPSQAACDAVASMRQKRDVLDEKVRSLRNSLLAHCKAKGDQSCSGDMSSLEGFLKKRMLCLLVRQRMQPWQIADFGSCNSHYNIRLNYLGFISQNISITKDHVPSCTVSNELQDQMIEKTFPNMDACEAFAYVFRGEAAAEMISPSSLSRKTQATQFLLRNAIDVVEEVQQARTEINNLICAKFCSPSECTLDILLYFVDINTYQKVTMSLSMTCLDRGIYPSEVLPNHVRVFMNGMPQSLEAEITAAARDLPSGYQRIMRLCRCVSELVRSRSNCTSMSSN